MSMNRIRRVVPTLALAGTLLAFVLAGAAGAASPPVGDWRMNEGSGTVLVDSSTFGNNGTIFGNPTWVAGQHGQAIRFDGTGDYATVPDNASLDISTAITMAAWVKPEAATTQNLIKKSTNGGTNGYELSLSQLGAASSQRAFVRFNQATSGDTYRVNATTMYPSHGTTWMHVAATYDGTTIRLYVNGVQEGQLAASIPIPTNNLALGIGAQPDGLFGVLQGTMDDVLLYNTALTASEIAALAAIPPGDPVFVGAGDIAGTWPDDTATGQLVSGIPGNVFTIGDNAYETGTAAEFVEYNNTWGAFKARTTAGCGQPRLRQRCDAGRHALLRLLQRRREPDRAGRRSGSRLLQLQHRQRGEHLARGRAELRVRARHRVLAAGRLRCRLGAGPVAQERPGDGADEQHHRHLAQAALGLVRKPHAHAAVVAGPLRRRG